MEYDEQSYLQLSGIQHFAFCQRQWALIHIEQQWQENYRTIDGMLMHKNAHNSDKFESRGSVLICRGMYIHSSKLGASGQCDVLEFHADSNGIKLNGRDGLWLPYPVEYKRGSEKLSDCDELQLCAQAMCLEEMLCCKIDEGALYYGETHRRTVVTFTSELREKVNDMFEQMHEYFKRGHTPKVKPKKGCNACSLKEICLPKIIKGKNVHAYLTEHLGDAI